MGGEQGDLLTGLGLPCSANERVLESHGTAQLPEWAKANELQRGISWLCEVYPLILTSRTRTWPGTAHRLLPCWSAPVVSCRSLGFPAISHGWKPGWLPRFFFNFFFSCREQGCYKQPVLVSCWAGARVYLGCAPIRGIAKWFSQVHLSTFLPARHQRSRALAPSAAPGLWVVSLPSRTMTFSFSHT